jgi:hypothetical protein
MQRRLEVEGDLSCHPASWIIRLGVKLDSVFEERRKSL